MTQPLHIIAEESIPYLRGVLEELGEVTYLPSGAFTADRVRDADWLIVRSITKCNRQLLEGSRVQLITTATIGFDHIDTDFCASAGITWYNAPGCNAEGVGQYFGSALARCQLEKGETLAGKTLGIVGVGHVGTVVKRYAEALGMRVLLNDPPRAEAEGAEGFVSLDQIAEESDVITLHTPLTKEGKYPTYHLCDWAFVSKLKRNPLLVNACRGAVADSTALLRGLEEGLIRDLILDCWEGEPNISRELLAKVFLGTPHIAGFSADGKCNGSRACVENGLRHFDLHSSHLELMEPPAPQSPVLNIDDFPEGHRVHHLLLSIYDPREMDEKLRANPEQFSSFRANYSFPREPHAYRVTGNISPAEREALAMIGFQVA